jgi:hypothetical protein
MTSAAGSKILNSKPLLAVLLFLSLCMRYSQAENPSGFCSECLRFRPEQPDTFLEHQLLYNGRVWQNLFYQVEGNQFLFSGEFLPGSVTMNGKKFTGISLKYDLYKDEILTPVSPGVILQLNKEYVDSFSFVYLQNMYRFKRMPEDGAAGQQGYVRVICDGKTGLYLKYHKKINRPGQENKRDVFYQLSRLYLVKGREIYPISGKHDLYKAFQEDKTAIREFIKENKIMISEKEPESCVPVIRYYDSLHP